MFLTIFIMLTYQCSYFVHSQAVCDPVSVKYIVYEGNPGLIFLVGKTASAPSDTAYLITKPVDFFHSLRYQSTHKGQKVPFEGNIPDVNVAFYVPDSGYWGFKSFSQIKYWKSFKELTKEPLTITQPDSTPVAYFNPSNYYNNAEFKATFTVPYKGNYSYCASMSQDGTPLFKCFDQKGATIHESNIGPFDAIDLFEWNGDNLIGVYFRTFAQGPSSVNLYWYRFFKVKYEKKYISFNSLGPWFHRTEPFHGCYLSMCFGYELEIAFKWNDTLHLGSPQQIIITPDWSMAHVDSRVPRDEPWIDKESIAVLDEKLWYYQDGVLKMLRDSRTRLTPNMQYTLDQHFGKGYADAAFTWSNGNITRVYFLKDSLYLTLLYDNNSAESLFSFDQYWNLPHYSLVNRLNGKIHLISDFNTFRFLDSAVEYSDNQVLFFYGHYFMNITNWSEDGRPVPDEYPIYLIADKLLNCSDPELDWRSSPYANFQAMVTTLYNLSLPERYEIPPDKNLTKLFTFLKIVIVSVVLTTFLISICALLVGAFLRKKNSPVVKEREFDFNETTSDEDPKHNKTKETTK